MDGSETTQSIQLINMRHQGHSSDNHGNSILARKLLLCSCWGKSRFLDLHQPQVCRWIPSTKDLASVKPGMKANATSFQLWSMSSLLDRWAKYSRAGSVSEAVKSCHMGARRLNPRPRMTLAPWLPSSKATAPNWASPGQVGTMSDCFVCPQTLAQCMT